jgi:hypothetical protein
VGNVFFSLQTLLAQEGGCAFEVEAVVGCSSQPSCFAVAAEMVVGYGAAVIMGLVILWLGQIEMLGMSRIKQLVRPLPVQAR